MSTIKFSSVRVLDGKKGILKPDADGYYTICLGGLNCENSYGAYYPLEPVRELFESSSIFMRRIKAGYLKAELGHPKQGRMTDTEFYQRCMEIDEKNVCAHISDVWLDETYGKTNPNAMNPQMCAIMGKIKPSGPYADVLERAINNGRENVCFSLRSITEDQFTGGKYIKTIKTIITFDMVNEPGIKTATKFDTPTLESRSVLEENYDKQITINQLKNLADKYNNRLVSNENASIINNIIESVQPKLNVKLPIYTEWK